LPEWLIERGIGETRAVLVEAGEIVEARITLEGAVPAGTVVEARLTDVGRNGRNAVALCADGSEFLLPRGAPGVTQGASIRIEVTREAIPGSEPWKRPLARLTEERPRGPAALQGIELSFPGSGDRLAQAGWNDLVEEARSGIVAFAGGELRISATPAMTLIDVDGYLPLDELARVGSGASARAIRRLDIGGSIGIDLPTAGSKAARQNAASAIDAVLPQPFERTAVNGFGFVQIVRPRLRPSLVELAQDRAAFEARALLRRLAMEPAGAKRIIAHPALVKLLEARPGWLDALARQAGGGIELRPEAALPISGGYAEKL
jgi:hypothetical protein